MATLPLIGAIEAGGTKFICAIGHGPHDVLARTRISTTTPAPTLAAVLAFFEEAERRHGPVAAFGIGSFGPIELDRDSPDWGRILTTPKPGWSGADLVAQLRTRFGRPVALDVDVGAAALAEMRLGAGRGTRSLAYVTVGTGIGAGIIINGQPLHGLMHPEAGHMHVRRAPGDSDFPGVCPYHGDCLEGLASGPAIQARWQRPLNELEAVYHEVIACYLGQLCANLALILSCERIAIGGGVMQTDGLLGRIHAQARALLNGYLPRPQHRGDLREFIVAPGLGEHAGLAGAFLLAGDALSVPPGPGPA
jgi:fructokinase